jgi:hypothetical protein
MVRYATPTFLEYWALINPTLMSCFQQDDHLILLDAMAHVKTDTYPFQIALRDTCAMLLKVVRSHVLPFENIMVQSYFQMKFSLKEQLHEQKFTLLLTNALLNILRTHFCSYVAPTIGAWLLVHPNTPSFHLSSTHFLTILCICLSIPHPTVPHVSQCKCGHTIDDLDIHLLHCTCGNECIATHDMP